MCFCPLYRPFCPPVRWQVSSMEKVLSECCFAQSPSARAPLALALSLSLCVSRTSGKPPSAGARDPRAGILSRASLGSYELSIGSRCCQLRERHSWGSSGVSVHWRLELFFKYDQFKHITPAEIHPWPWTHFFPSYSGVDKQTWNVTSEGLYWILYGNVGYVVLLSWWSGMNYITMRIYEV